MHVSLVSPIVALWRRAQDEPDRIAMVAEDGPWTTARLVRKSERLAAGLLARGVAAGDRMALHLHNTSDTVVALLACVRIGAVAVPLNTQLTTPELSDLIARTCPLLYLGEHDLYSRVAPMTETLLPKKSRFLAAPPGTTTSGLGWPQLANIDDCSTLDKVEPELDSPAFLLSTSGSTGISKIVVWSHRNLAALHLSGNGRGISHDDVLPIMTPLMHASGVYHLFTALAQGAVAVLINPFEPGAVLDAVQKHRITTTFGMPYMCSALAHEQQRRPRDVSSLRAGFVSGDTCPAEIVSEFSHVFDAPLRAFWAATEDVGSTVAAVDTGPCVRIVPEATVHIIDSDGHAVFPGAMGEMLVSSPTTTPGYWHGPGDYTPMPGGFFHTGDLVCEREPGLLEYLGRAKDVIVRGGAKISPTEVEEALRSHPAVADAGVAGLPDATLGQRVGALVVYAAGRDRPSNHDLASWLSARLAAWKVPEHLHAADAIPRNALTKIDRAVVRHELARLSR
jgi:acyl-CoA synthetase (AMP-forming)/AMP-acid ligase II